MSPARVFAFTARGALAAPPPRLATRLARQVRLAFAAVSLALAAWFGPACSPADSIDRQFIDMMVPHHEGAIAMAEIALERSRRPEIRNLAQEITRSQQGEIDRMRTWRRQWFGSDQTPPMERMPMLPGMGGAHARHGASMNLRADAERLRTTDGDFDLAFLGAMIPHHRDAIEAARILRTRTTRAEMRELADAIVAAQQQEIDQMQRWRAAWTTR